MDLHGRKAGQFSEWRLRWLRVLLRFSATVCLAHGLVFFGVGNMLLALASPGWHLLRVFRIPEGILPLC
jgi:hypothetical protein